MAYPLFRDRIAFASLPLATVQTYTDVTDHVESRSLRRGRQTEDDTAATGTGGLVLIDDDRRYDPENTVGLYAPNVVPMRRINSQWSQDGGTTWNDLFTTFIDIENGWRRDDSQTGPATVSVPGNDAFDLLANAYLSATQTFAQELSGTRINNILNAIGWPAALRNIDAGQETVQAVTAGNANKDALSLIRDAETADSGYFFIDASGNAVFQDRHHRLVSPYTVSQATFCDVPNSAGGGILYEKVTTRQSRIYNDIQVTRAGGTLQEEKDTTSIASYGLRTLSKQTQQISDSNADLLAGWLLGQKSTSYTRYEELVLRPGTDTATWTQVLTRAIGDRITVTRTPFGGAQVESVDCIIEAISLDINAGIDAVCTWRLSPAPATGYWVLGDPVNGLLGKTTKLVY
jgi:hypothetical protein